MPQKTIEVPNLPAVLERVGIGKTFAGTAALVLASLAGMLSGDLSLFEGLMGLATALGIFGAADKIEKSKIEVAQDIDDVEATVDDIADEVGTGASAP